MPKIQKVEKRDGSLEDFDASRIQDAIHRAFIGMGREDGENAKHVTERIVEKLEKEGGTPSVEEIQDLVVETLEEEGFEEVAEDYQNYREQKQEIRDLKNRLGYEPKIKLSINSLSVLRERYLLRNDQGELIETPEGMFERVAEGIAEVDEKYDGDPEETEERFREMMSNLEFLPNSPTLFNTNAPLGGLSGCYVLPVHDSLESIFSTLKKMAIVEQSGGGVGFNFSELRPEGDIVRSTHGVASGPVSFMRVYDTATEIMKQGGKRRGALMGILDVGHPEIMKFVNAKRKQNILSNFNLSVSVTDDFMEKVKNGGEQELVNPRTDEVVKKVDAEEIWNQIVKNAWATGDPGLLFIDEVNRHNPTPDEPIRATNPCVTGNTLIYTCEGLQEAGNLTGKNKLEIEVDERLSDETKKTNPGVFCTGEKDVYKLNTKEGYEVDLTENHKVMTDRGWVRVSDLEKDEEIHIFKKEEVNSFGDKGSYELGAVTGWFVGDGCFSDRAELNFYHQDGELADDFAEMVNEIVSNMRTKGYRKNYHVGARKKKERDLKTVRSQRLKRKLKEIGLSPGNKHQVPNGVFEGTKEMQKGFLQGLFSADGSFQGSLEKGYSVRLSQSDKELLKDVQKLLLNFGIFSKIYKRRDAGEKKMPDGHGGEKKYNFKAQYGLIISKNCLEKFKDEIGFLLNYKQKKLERGLKNYTKGPYREKFKARFESLEYLGKEKVYDLKEPDTHSFIADGLVVHNCGETALLPWESCNLGSINLSKMVEDEEIDWDKLERTTKDAVHFLDNVIDANDYPYEKIEEKTKATRKIGLGVMGFADMLVQLDIPYDSEEAVDTAEDVMGFIQEKAREKSAELGRERGSFPKFEESVYAEEWDAMRNATVTTIAPTGTISIIANCSSGIEPYFALSYIRNVLGGSRLLEINPYFERISKERDFYSAELLDKISREGSIQGIEEVPEDVKKIFKTALDIDPEWHVRMQAAFQKYVDNSVSKTINLPRDAGKEEIEEAFRLAWKLNCKGITVYRYGSKEEQVLQISEDERLQAESEFSGTCEKCHL